MVLTSLHKRNRLTNLSTLPYLITQSWSFTVPIPHWILHFFHIEGGLLITIQLTISANQTEEEFNSFTIGIIFRWRTERSIPPHPIEESRIVFGYLWPNLYYQIKEDLIVCTPSRGSIVTGVTTSGTTTPVDPPSPPEELHKVPLPPDTLLNFQAWQKSLNSTWIQQKGSRSSTKSWTIQ